MEYPWFASYEEGVAHSIDPEEYGSLTELFEESWAKFGSLPAFHSMGTTYTYAEFDTMSKKFASYLQQALHLQKGDRIALMMPNILQYPVALFGALRAGLAVVGVNPLYKVRELEHQLRDSGAKAIVIFENSCSVLQEAIGRTDVRYVITTEIGDLLSFPKSLLVNFVVKRIKKMVPPWKIVESIPFKEALVLGDASLYEKPDISPEDTAFLQYTGGTTGVPKGAVLTHRNICANVVQARAWIKNFLEPGREIVVTPLPLYHIFSLTANCFIFGSIGALNILVANPRDIGGFVKELDKWKFTALTGVNTLFNALLNHQDFQDIDFGSLKIALGGGMAVQREIASRWKETTGVPLVEAYGLTETSPAACINPMGLKNFNGKIGLPIPSTIVAIKDDEGADLPTNAKGEICIKGPQVMRGYWNRPEETARIMTADGFLKTGDIGFMDEGGYVEIVDRKKDMILVSGFNVYPNEIEDVMVSHPQILEAAVVGIAHPKSGEAAKAYIVKKDPALTAEEVRNFCREHLTDYKIPKYYEFRDELPKNPVGKILRKDLREEAPPSS